MLQGKFGNFENPWRGGGHLQKLESWCGVIKGGVTVVEGEGGGDGDGAVFVKVSKVMVVTRGHRLMGSYREYNTNICHTNNLHLGTHFFNFAQEKLRESTQFNFSFLDIKNRRRKRVVKLNETFIDIGQILVETVSCV